MDNEITYGMLMRRVQINEELYMLTPIHLIEGVVLEKNIFTDTLGKDYLIFQSGTSFEEDVYLDEEFYIGPTITVEQLKKAYPGENIENATMYFYDNMKEYCMFCMLDIDGYYKFVYMNVNAACEEYISALKRLKEKENTEDNNEKQETKQVIEEEIVGINNDEIEYLMGLVNNKDYRALTERLNDYKGYLSDEVQIDVVEETEEINAKESEQKQVVTEEKTEIDVKDFYTKTKKKIIGQDEAIKEVIIAAKMDQYAKTPSEKNRCFIIGPTGTGKTEIVKCLGEYLDKPSIKVDTTQLTTPGYVGGTIEEVLERLVGVAGGDIKKAENGIITFDEIDKKCGSEDKMFGQGFLYTLLPFLDGTDYTITLNGKKANFNTSNLTIFASGSFSEIIKNTSLDKKSIGFGIKADNKEDSPYLNPDEIFKRASMPEEIIGRFPVVIQLNSHTEESLTKILVESDISQLKAEQRKFEHLGVELNWEEKYIEAVAKEAIKANIGARSLKKIVEKSIKDLSWEVLTNPKKYNSATLLEETVSNPKVYRLK